MSHCLLLYIPFVYNCLQFWKSEPVTLFHKAHSNMNCSEISGCHHESDAATWCGSVPPCTLPTVACVRARIWPVAPPRKQLCYSSPLCQLPCLATSVPLLKAHTFCCEVEKKLWCCADVLRGVCTVAEDEEMEICRWAFPHLRESTMDNIKAWINMQSATSVWWLIQTLARKKEFPSLALGKVLI